MRGRFPDCCIFFYRFKLLPRVLRDVSNRDTTTTILGHRIEFPVGIASTAMHRMAHPEGEVATAKGKKYTHLSHFAV